MQKCQKVRIEKWDHRHWAVYDGSELVCVTVYKKGSLEVKRRLEEKAGENAGLMLNVSYYPHRLNPHPINTLSRAR